MRRIKFLSMFVLLILVSSIATGQVMGQEPSVENSSLTEKNADELWSPEEVTYYASVQIEDFSNDNLLEEFKSWQNATVGTITLVRDATGDPVLYDVTVESDGRAVGLIQIWAKKLMGVPFHTVSADTLWIDLREQVDEAHQIATQKLGSSKIIKSEMVYVAYPQRAFALTFQEGDVIDQVLVDVTTKRIVSADEVVPFATMLHADNLRESMQEWQVLQKELEGPVDRQAIRSKTLNVSLFGQLNDCFCVPATAQMIHHFRKGWSPNQYTLAAKFGTVYPDPPCGTPDQNLVPGWNQLGFPSSHHWSKAPWSTVKARIDNNKPFMSGFDRGRLWHMRAITGYRQTSRGNQARIHDPLPIGRGTVYWEDRSSTSEYEHIIIY